MLVCLKSFKTLSQCYKLKLVALFEPRCSGVKADMFIKKSGFARSHRVEAIGFSGGIWIFWNENIDVEILENHRQYIHMQVDDRRGTNCLITAIYASPVPTVRKQLWINLNRLALGMGDPWLIGGDFNAFIHASEKMGGSSRRQGTCSLFSEWINNNSLYDLGFKGTKFTWSRGSVAERLDRTISNGLWLNKFQEASTWHLPRIHSDHCPLLVHFGNSSGAREGKSLFRFQVAWLLNYGFNKLVREEWHVNAEYAQNVNNFTNKVMKWES